MSQIEEWLQWRKSAARPSDIPTEPGRVYRHEGWLGLDHWLGMTRGDASTKTQGNASKVITKGADSRVSMHVRDEALVSTSHRASSADR
eukprot:scaffold7446_cov403-Prasinococcus_capsulatus_cf.AAC.14